MAYIPKTIRLRQTRSYVDEAIINNASASFVPGILVEFTSTGEVVAHSSADDNARAMFLVEQDTGDQDINTAYLADSTAEYLVCNSGDRILARVAAAQAITTGDFLSSAGDGTLKTAAAPAANATQNLVAVAKETVGSVPAFPDNLVEVEIF